MVFIVFVFIAVVYNEVFSPSKSTNIRWMYDNNDCLVMMTKWVRRCICLCLCLYIWKKKIVQQKEKRGKQNKFTKMNTRRMVCTAMSGQHTLHVLTYQNSHRYAPVTFVLFTNPWSDLPCNTHKRTQYTYMQHIHTRALVRTSF